MSKIPFVYAFSLYEYPGAAEDNGNPGQKEFDLKITRFISHDHVGPHQ